MYVVRLSESLLDPAVHRARAAHRTVGAPERRARLISRSSLSFDFLRHLADRLPTASDALCSIGRRDDEQRSVGRNAS